MFSRVWLFSSELERAYFPLGVDCSYALDQEKSPSILQAPRFKCVGKPITPATGLEWDRSLYRGFSDLCPVANGCKDATDAYVPGSTSPWDKMRDLFSKVIV